jgi:hypothetical protein
MIGTPRSTGQAMRAPIDLDGSAVSRLNLQNLFCQGPSAYLGCTDPANWSRTLRRLASNLLVATSSRLKGKSCILSSWFVLRHSFSETRVAPHDFGSGDADLDMS